MQNERFPQIIEALLFIQAKPLKIKEIAEGLDLTLEEVETAAKNLSKNLKNRGIVLLRKGNRLELNACKESAPYLEKFRKKELRSPLSRTALETLAIIAYQGPLTRFEVENIRGVNCTWILRALLVRGLIERQTQGRKTYYQVSMEFLKYLGLKSLEELPDYAKMKKQ